MTTTIAVAQMTANPAYAENLTRAEAASRQAASRGARLIVFPEIYMAGLTPSELKAERVSSLSQPLDGPFTQGLTAIARQMGIWIIAGMLETAQEGEKAYNTTLVINDQGELVTFYRKTHMFDAFGHKESHAFASGDSLFEPIETPFGRLGLFVCYELRFPEVARYQAQRGVDLFVMPSAWLNGSMKEVHWRHLIIARAIENTAYMITSDMAGDYWLGRSLVVDPMGVILAEGTEGECLIYADIDPSRLREVRNKVPSIAHHRAELYTQERTTKAKTVSHIIS